MGVSWGRCWREAATQKNGSVVNAAANRSTYMTEYSEPELVLPALALLGDSPSGLTTSDLIRELTALLRPTGRDAEILPGRRDTYFSQKVRNLVSHKTLIGPGFEVYDPARQHHEITAAGRQFLQEARDRGDLAAAVTPAPNLAPEQVFPAYRRANETPATRPRQPFEVDPNEVDRALGAHAATQNAVASWLDEQGLTPLRPGGSSADFDVAWDDAVQLNVAEVKSVTEGNETRQLRLGLGQVLHYAMLLGAGGRRVRPILVVERAPTDGRWVDLCATHGVLLVWPGDFDRLAVRRP